jgi:hypothetical protein
LEKERDTFLPLRSHEVEIELIHMAHEIPLILNLPMLGDQSWNCAFSPPPVGNGMKVHSAGVPMEGPLHPAPLPPILLLELVQCNELVLELVSQGLVILI